MVIHADYTQNCYTQYPNFNHPKIKRILAITSYIQETANKKFNLQTELCYNPIALEPKERRLMIVSATRLSPIKGGERMKKIAEALDTARHKLRLVHFHKFNRHDPQQQRDFYARTTRRL